MGQVPSYGSWDGNGQLLGVFTQRAVNRIPAPVGPGLSGYGQSPLATIPRIPGGAGVGSGAFTPSPQPAAMGQGVGPMGMGTKITLVVMLIVGVWGLRYVHWRG